MSALVDLRGAVRRAALDLAGGELASEPSLGRPKQSGHGDYATNAAMLLAKPLGRPPREIAEQLAATLREALGADVERIEVAGPGFLNLFMTDRWHTGALTAIAGAGSGYGAGGAAEPRNVNVEFVSANPTGPMHVGHARNAVYGDSLARLLAFAGHEVHREFYVNDAGSQIQRFGASIQARARGEEPPEGGYVGEYVIELAARIPDAATADLELVARTGVELMLADARASLTALGLLDFDTWTSEARLHAGTPSKVQHAFDVLTEQGRTYHADGAFWCRTTEFGDDKDRVLERSSGEHTYFASDCAYHQDKRERGFNLLIDVWGADHHGYVQRTRAAYLALGGSADELELLIMQFVNLVGGLTMSKRAGTFVTLDELVAEIGRDAARWFLAARSHDTTIDLDLDLARSQSADNPVYYVQYAHARIASVLRRAQDDTGDPGGLGAAALHPSERALIQRLADFPDECAEAAARRAPHRMCSYALDLAQVFTAFYRDCPVVGADTQAFRVALCASAMAVLAQSLELLGISAPEEM